MKRQLWLVPIVVLCSGLCGPRLAFPAEADSAAEVISADPGVLQMKFLLPKSEGVQIGPNIRFDPDKRVIFTQFQPGDVTTTDFTLKNADGAIKVIAILRGDVPPYIVDFEQSGLCRRLQTLSAINRWNFPRANLHASAYSTFSKFRVSMETDSRSAHEA